MIAYKRHITLRTKMYQNMKTTYWWLGIKKDEISGVCKEAWANPNLCLSLQNSVHYVLGCKIL